MSNLPPGCTPAMLDAAWGDPRPCPAIDCRCPLCGWSEADGRDPDPSCERCDGNQLTTDDLTAREFDRWADEHAPSRDYPIEDDDYTDSPEHRLGVDA